MQDRRLKTNKDMEPKLSLEKAEEILRNVYRAAGIDPPKNCAEIIRRGTKSDFQMKDKG